MSQETEGKGVGRREVLGAAAAAGLAAALGAQASTAQAQEKGDRPQFCVIPHKSLAAVHDRSAEEIIAAQKKLDDRVLTALESMVKAARAGKLEGRAALSLAAVAW